MKPNFALALLPEGITLLHRAAGGWRRVDTVPLDAPDMGKRLAAMRNQALALEPGGLRSKVVIPNDQIRYMTLETGAINVDARWQAARAAMDGATPYALDELALDISVDGPLTHLAAVARETLQEAETFAVEHQFHPVSFVAIPGEHPFVGEPFFGPSEHAATLPGGTEVEADGVAIVVIGDAPPPGSPPAQDATPTTEEATTEEATTEEATAEAATAAEEAAEEAGGTAEAAAAALPGFTSRRAGTGNATAPEGAAPAAALPEAPRRLRIVPPGRGAPRPAAPPEAPSESLSGAGTARAAGDGLPKAPPPARPEPPRAPSRAAPASPRIEDLAPDDETGRLTLFGARRPTRPSDPRKGRHLGLILALGLLAVLALIALWAMLFLDDDLAGLFRRDSPAPPAVAVAPVPERTAGEADAGDGGEDALRPAPEAGGAGPRQPTANSLEDGLPALPVASLPAPRQVPLMQPQGTAQDRAVPHAPDRAAPADGVDPGLTGTDSAVLEALRDRQNEADTTAGAGAGFAAPTALTPERADAIYAASGIWLTPPQVPEAPSIISLDDLRVASIDRTDLASDAVALPAVRELETDQPPTARTRPAVAGRRFDLDERGLVTPSPEGTLNPDGILVHAGRPPVVPPPPPPRAEPETEADRLRKRLAGIRPQPRPVENVAAETPLAADRERLARLRPRPRPETQAETQAGAQPPAADAGGTVLAVRTAPRPAVRPANLAPARRTAAPAAAATAAGAPRIVAPPAQPGGRTPATVARHATAENVISLRRINLIGVFGTPSNRRALVRLPSGRYKKVKVGDRLDGGRVIAIGERELRYQKKGRNLTLSLPRG